ncbi:PREDICTED: trypsin-like [Ceratosolen solmsi marchali]|uniref:Trypsin-like n=1 Tax=Ceratosolen solmsi marchali TaxID=326594 RepID=A0AAJ6VK05_9HYME|nr:PREDICTED: trypsin-like [Ceratosolen solmsi marchali]
MRDVLTSEHCFYGAIVEGIKILVGSIKLSQATQFSPEWWISYNKWAVVNGIDTQHYDNDIVVIRLLEEVRGETNARIAMLSYSFLPLRGTNVEIVGWGILNNRNMSDVLQIAATEILANDACGDRVTALDGDRVTFDSRYICTYTEPCILLQFGDSGGPLIHNNEVVGINIGTCPVLDVVIHPAKVNIHLATRYYKRFIQDIVYEYL